MSDSIPEFRSREAHPTTVGQFWSPLLLGGFETWCSELHLSICPGLASAGSLLYDPLPASQISSTNRPEILNPNQEMDGSTPGPIPQQFYIPGGYFYGAEAPPMFRQPFSYGDYNPPWFFPPPASSSSSSSRSGINRASILTPAIVAGVALLGSAILLISYYKIFARYCAAWQSFWGIGRNNDGDSGLRSERQQQLLEQQGGWFLAMNSGLDEAIVRKIPVYVYKSGEGIAGNQECVVCLGEFEEDDELRILPKCSHAFHLSCIDVWLRSHSNCPLCRAPVLFVPAQTIAADEHEQEQVIALQIEDVDHEAGRHPNPNPCSAEFTQALARSASLRADDFRSKSWRWRVVPLPRSNSTGSHHLRELVLLAAYDQMLAPSPASNLILVPHNSAELDKQLEDADDDGYVVLNIELASASTSSSSSSSSSSNQREAIENSESSGGNRSPSRLSVRRSLFKPSSLRRSLSSGRVFSFRRFSRSRSVA